MAITKEKKKVILEKLKSILEKASTVVFVNFKGLNVTNTTEMRNALRSKGVSYFVAKKTLTRKAVSEEGFGGDLPELPGELAIAYSNEDDLTLAPREVFAFQKKFKDSIAIVGGIFEKNIVDKENMLGIALVPDQLTLRAQFVNVINSPIQGLVLALSAMARNKN